MRRIIIFLAIIAMSLPGIHASAQKSTKQEIKDYREDMKEITKDDSGYARQLREERRELLRKGSTMDQIREEQTRKIEERRRPPAQPSRQDAPTGREGTWSGFVMYEEPAPAGEYTTEK